MDYIMLKLKIPLEDVEKKIAGYKIKPSEGNLYIIFGIARFYFLPKSLSSRLLE